MTSSINNVYGAMVRSERLGIVYNDHVRSWSDSFIVSL